MSSKDPQLSMGYEMIRILISMAYYEPPIVSFFLQWILPSAAIVIGLVYLNECPRQPFIPMYLIVSGVISQVLALFSCQRSRLDLLFMMVSMIWNPQMSFFIGCWFVAGNMLIYSIYEPNYDKNMTHVEPYCNRTLYLFAFWTTNLSYIILALQLFCCFCVLLWYRRRVDSAAAADSSSVLWLSMAQAQSRPSLDLSSGTTSV